MRELARLVGGWLWQRRWRVGGAALGTFLLVVGPTIYAQLATKGERYDAAQIASVPEREVAIVFGAGVLPSGEPTPYLKRRIQTAADLYHAGKVKRLLLSGDNNVEYYNEPEAMQYYAIAQGIAAEDITLDYAGFNTYDTCYRARAIFGLERAIVVSQGYHLPRAMVTCSGLGVRVIGVAAKHQGRDFAATYILREFVSTDKALLQLLFKPQPTMLGESESMIVD